MNRTNSLLVTMLVAFAALVLCNGCSRKRTLEIKAFIDGSDLIKVNGSALNIEHESYELPGKTLYINGKPWRPKWTDKLSDDFNGVAPAFAPRDPASVQISKKTGRGEVTIVERPSTQNNGTLVIRFNDDDFPGADWYDVLVTW